MMGMIKSGRVSRIHQYKDLKTGAFHAFHDPLSSYGDKPLFSCILQARRQDSFLESSDDLDRIKRQLCKPFKTAVLQ